MREPTPGPIFVGGTGRSGTSVLKQLIGTHPAVFAAPNEAKFLVEPDGLIDLVDALSTHWSPWKSERALARFDRFMRSLSWRGRWAERRVRGIAWRLRRLRSRDFSLARYSNERLGDRLGREHYFGTLADFLAEMEELRFPGWVVGIRSLPRAAADPSGQAIPAGGDRRTKRCLRRRALRAVCGSGRRPAMVRGHARERDARRLPP